MKKILLSLFVFAVVGTTAKVQSQACTVKQAFISINTKAVVSGSLQINFNINFDLDANGGNKAIFLTSWLTTQYPNYFLCSNGSATLNPLKAPLSADLTTAFLKLAINNFGASPVFYANYAFDNSVVLNSAGTISKVQIIIGGITYDRFTLSNIVATIPGITNASDPLLVTTDVFSTNGTPSGPNSPLHCVNCGNLQYFNDPLITGIVPCSQPRTINFAFTSIRPSKQFYYRIYADDGDGSFEPGAGDIDVTIGTNPTVTTDVSGAVPLATYPIVQPTPGTPLGNYWVSVVAVGDFSGVAQLLKPLPNVVCATLPVDFKSFTATRNRSNVLLKWETMTERNSEGFAVDRNVGGTWEQIAFIPSRAQGGSSDALLAYTYIDLNQYKGISQYRIRQVDFDSRSKYTDIRSVRGEGQTGKTIVYPNPTNDGRVSVVFEETNVSRNVSVMDMSGRIIKEWRSITNNNLTIDNLNPGMYSLRIVAVETGEQSVQKIVVNKR